MPIPRYPVQVESDSEAHRERAAFRCGFKRSRKGNLWCRWGDMAVVVFVRTSGCDLGRYGWVISAGDERPVFSVNCFQTEADAIEDLVSALEVGK